ncbi:hypothetical protein [Streptomyces tsukubensis]|uniref:hypothetical protein n=1 Tax=Streptomyces tsukubensis TaxID=83656 RepID=UPI00344DEC9D
MDFFDHISGASCVNCESDPCRDGELFCSSGCRAEFEGLDEMTPEQLYVHFFAEARTNGMEAQEAGDYALKCVQLFA